MPDVKAAAELAAIDFRAAVPKLRRFLEPCQFGARNIPSRVPPLSLTSLEPDVALGGHHGLR